MFMNSVPVYSVQKVVSYISILYVLFQQRQRTAFQNIIERLPRKASCQAKLEESGPTGVICTEVNGPLLLACPAGPYRLPGQVLLSCELPAIPAAAAVAGIKQKIYN
jgi:hypothetical protein